MEQLIKIILLTSLMTSLCQTTAEFCKAGIMTQIRLNGQTWCIMYNRLLRTFHKANAECNKLTGGPNNSFRGHLVEIFSQEDNQVIRSFIQKKKDPLSGPEFRAFIGLYRTNNTFRWVNSTQVPKYFDVDPSYSGWMLKVDESMRGDGINKGSDWQPAGPVVITETDWKIYDNSSTFVCQVPPTADFCKVGNMTKVRLNGQTWCIKYNKLLRSFHNANAECNKLTGGPNNSLRGHLVEIFSQEDNQVIKSFIQKEKDPLSGPEFRAFIGLYRVNNTFRWVNSTQVPTYFDADPIYSGSMLKVDESMRRDGIYKSSDWQPDVPVIITETDWKIYDNSSNFVCQVPPNTSMNIACMDKEEGSSGTMVEATLRSPDIFNFLNQDLSLGRSIIVVRRNGHVIDHNITVNKDAITVNVMCDKCSLADEGQYVINVSTVFKWNNFEETCDLKIYQKDDLSFLYYVVPIAALVALAAVVALCIYKVRRQRAIKRRNDLMVLSALNEQSLSSPMVSNGYLLPVDPHGGNAQISDTATYELSENYYSSIKNTDVMNEGAACDGQSEITTGRDENQASGVNRLSEIDTKTDLKFDNKIYIQFGAKSDGQVDRTVDKKLDVNRDGEIDFKTIGHLDRKTDGQLDNQTYGRLYMKSDGQLEETKDVKLDTKRSVDRDIKKDTQQKSGASEQLDEDQQNESTPADGLNDNAMLYDTPGNDFSPEVNEYMTLKF